jgi:hypothetical protein
LNFSEFPFKKPTATAQAWNSQWVERWGWCGFGGMGYRGVGVFGCEIWTASWVAICVNLDQGMSWDEVEIENGGVGVDSVDCVNCGLILIIV